MVIKMDEPFLLSTLKALLSDAKEWTYIEKEMVEPIKLDMTSPHLNKDSVRQQIAEHLAERGYAAIDTSQTEGERR